MSIGAFDSALPRGGRGECLVSARARSPSRAMPQPHRVVVLALEHVVPFDLGTPTQVFRRATKADNRPLYEVLVCTPDGGPVRTNAGYQVLPEHDLTALETADTVVVPGIYGGAPLRDGSLDPVVRQALLAASGAGKRLVSICTGAFVLAAAGLLDGRPAATHWWHADNFRRLFPNVRLDADVLFVDDGDVLSSAGVGAGIDLCMHVVRRDHGSEVANRSARRSVLPPWRDGGQAQFIERPLPASNGTTIEATRVWLLDRLEQPVTLSTMAAHAGMSVRTFSRRFRAETGLSPGEWLTRQRVERARHLLEETDLSVDLVARDAGFGTAVSLRQHLRAVLGLSPLAYRRWRTAARSAALPADRVVSESEHRMGT